MPLCETFATAVVVVVAVVDGVVIVMFYLWKESHTSSTYTNLAHPHKGKGWVDHLHCKELGCCV